MPVWRNNWLLVESGEIDAPSFGTAEALEARKQPMPVEQRWLKVEYQTLRRLPATNDILFTVRTLLEPVTIIADVPGAAACLAASMRGMSPLLLEYKGVTPEATPAVLAFLDEIAAREGAGARAR